MGKVFDSSTLVRLPSGAFWRRRAAWVCPRSDPHFESLNLLVLIPAHIESLLPERLNVCVKRSYRSTRIT